MKLLSAFIITFVLVSCATSKETTDPWIGKTKQDVLMDKGAPSQTATDGKDGEILVFTRRKVYDLSGNHFDKTYESQFFVNKDGVVYHTLYRTYNTPPQNIRVDISTKKEDKLVTPGYNN